MNYKESVKEAIWIERTKNSLTYKEIADKLGVSMYMVKKVIYERSHQGSTRKNKKD